MNYTARSTHQSWWRSLRQPLPLLILSVVVVTLVLLLLEVTNTTHIFHKQSVVSSTIPTTTTDRADSVNSDTSYNTPESTSAGQKEATSTANEKTAVSPSSGSELLAPSGNFVSSHRPSLKDSPGQESICTTTPAAFCIIVFTKDGVIKTLESKKANSSGTVIWNWDIKSAGFVVGSWKITATTSLNGQSKSTTDLQNLEVQP